MSTKISFDIRGELARQVKRVKRNQDIFTKKLFDLIGTKTPEATKRLIHSNTIIRAKQVGNKVLSSVENETDYAEKVEYGEGRVYNYHKNGKTFYTGVGAGMFYKSAFEMEDEFKTFIEK